MPSVYSIRLVILAFTLIRVISCGFYFISSALLYWFTEFITLVRRRNVSSTALCRGRLDGISRTICLNAAAFAHFVPNRVHFARCSVSPDEAWMKQIGRNLTDKFDGFLNGKQYVLMDRDGKFCHVFREILKDEEIKPLRLPPRSPNLNAHVERFHRSLKDECLDRMIFFGEKSLRNAIKTFLEHFHADRNHQAIENRLIKPGEEVGLRDGDVLCRERLGGMLRYFYRKAA